jgi:23S rRNA (guanine745-N1)-methyltransferase
LLLVAEARAYQCETRHSFDIAKQGYINLLLAKQGIKELGDTKLMFSHRRQFLDRGYYNPISDKVNQRVATALASSAAPTVSVINILDAGCGEGFYTKRLKDSLAAEAQLQFQFFGIDISKLGIQYAARRDKAITFAVASVSTLPFADASLDWIVSFFSPVNYAEFSRVLKTTGKLITAKAGPQHLYELRQQLLQEEVESLQDKASNKFKTHFELEYTTEVQYDLVLTDGAAIADLALMTPYAWHLAAERRSQLEQLESLQTTIDVTIKMFGKL